MRLRAEVPRHALAGQLVLSKPGLLCQLVPSLEMSYVLRELFRVPGGEGRILNIDESMTYRYDQMKNRGLTKENLLYYYFRRLENFIAVF